MRRPPRVPRRLRPRPTRPHRRRWDDLSPKKTSFSTWSSQGSMPTRNRGETRPRTRCSMTRRWARCSRLVAGQLVDKALDVLAQPQAERARNRHAGQGGRQVGVGSSPSTWAQAGRRRSDLCLARRRQQRAQAALEPADGMDDGDRKSPRSNERTGARTVVVVTDQDPCGGGSGAPARAWVWWPEKNDLVIGGPFPLRSRPNHRGRWTARPPVRSITPLVQELKSRRDLSSRSAWLSSTSLAAVRTCR